MASKRGIAVAVKLLGLASTRQVTGEELDVWMRVLAPIGDELLSAAAIEVLRTEKKRVDLAPGVLYQAAVEVAGRRLPSPGQAWQLAVDTVRYDTDPAELPAPVYQAYAQVGGANMRNLQVGDFATRARFLEFYRDARGRAVRQSLLALPPGDESPALTADAPALEGGSDG